MCDTHLRQCDVAHICQGCDDQAFFDSQVLIAVLKVDITDGDDGGVLVITPVETHLLQPLEVGWVSDLHWMNTRSVIMPFSPVLGLPDLPRVAS